jgi:hypothetical protein
MNSKPIVRARKVDFIVYRLSLSLIALDCLDAMAIALVPRLRPAAGTGNKAFAVFGIEGKCRFGPQFIRKER